MGQWPLYLLLILLTFLGPREYSVDSAITWNSNINVGTVLFDEASTSCNHCWTKEELVLLSSRKAFQNLLPEVDTSRMQDDLYISNLLSLIRSSLDRVNSMSSGKSKHLLLRSYADAIGGYLHTYVVPIAKVAYYAGNVEQRNIHRLLELLAEIKDFLRTNAVGWTQPLRVEMFINVTPIVMPDYSDPNACAQLIVNSASEIANRKAEDSKSGERLKMGQLDERLCDDKSDSSSSGPGCSFIFLPYFDNDLEPNSIALPFKDHNLWSLYDEKSIFILSKYYKTSVQCINSMPDSKVILAAFNRDFYKWLVKSVYPRLSDNKWYPALGGILKIIEFLRGKEKFFESILSPQGFDLWGTLQLILVAISTAAVVWLLVGLTLACYKCRQRRLSECSTCEFSSSKSIPFEDVNYCDLDSCKNLHRKSLCERIKGWCRRKDETCPDSHYDISEREPCLRSSNYKSKESIRTRGRKVYKKRKKTKRSVSISASPSSQYTYYENEKFRYSSDMLTTSDDSSCR